ncbi:MAG: thioredoxin family protein [Melioribacteraceae bacterium]|nr:thioredoxin family protein [Melioribacteraceae bacterium]MCO6474934.1 thioredoxin family protein [Melioribacteraceae bacterium]MDD3558207.1 thioredoxin family protein [Melioribacteraceae bacterium]
MADNEIETLIHTNSAVLLYVSTEECSVCKVLKPKVIEMINENFPRILFLYVDAEDSKEAAAQLSVFSVPTIIVYFEGREYIRKSRTVGLSELQEEIERLYKMMFED